MRDPASNPFHKYISERAFILVYGAFSTGKTHLAYEAYTYAGVIGYDPLFIATEPGSRGYLRNLGFNPRSILSMDELAAEATQAVLSGKYVVVDSVNWFYRERPGPEHGRVLAYISALLGRAGGFVTAQVSGEGEEVSGSPYILPWARVVAKSSREKGLYLLEFETPVKKVYGFEIRGGRVEWV